MSNQLHRRLAYRTGGTGTDTTSDSFWDSSDFSTAHVVSSMQLFNRRMKVSGSGTTASPYTLSSVYDSTAPWVTHPDAIFLGGGVHPIIVFGGGQDLTASYGNTVRLSMSFRAFDFIGTGERLASNPISGNVSKWPNQPSVVGSISSGYSSSPGETQHNRYFVSRLCTGCTTVDDTGKHWYFLQTSNNTGTFYTNVGYAPYDSSTGSGYSPTYHETRGSSPTAYQAINLSTNYGVRILHFATPNGGYPLQASRDAMVTSIKTPGSYTYYSGTGTTALTDRTRVGVKHLAGNRQDWDFTLLALRSGDMSPSGLFTNDYPLNIQCIDNGNRMAILSALSTNGQALTIRPMGTAYDISTLSTTVTSRALTDFSEQILTAIDSTASWIQWVWFKFSPDGKKLIILSNGGVLVKFRLTSAYDLSTMALVTATRLQAQTDSVPPYPDYYWSAFSVSTYTGTTHLRRPIASADIDPDGQSLILTVANRLAPDQSYDGGPYSDHLVQYRL